MLTTSKLQRWLTWLPLIFVVVWSGTPLLWSLVSSFKTRSDFSKVPPPFFPTEWTLQGYEGVFSDPRLWQFGWNSLLIAVISTVLTVVLSSLAAYGFARYAFPFRHVLLLLVLVPRLVPRVSLIVPIFELLKGVGLFNTHVGLIIVYTGAAIPLATWIMIGFFGAVPKELDEAARVDGAGTLRIFFSIVVPLTIPGLLTIALMSFRDAWNEFPFVLALTNGPSVRTLPYQLFLFRDSVGVDDYALIQAFTVLSILPIILIYIRLEKYVVSGLTSGAVK